MFDVALNVRTSVNQIIGENDRRKVWVEIICNQKNFKVLQVHTQFALMQINQIHIIHEINFNRIMIYSQILHPDSCNSELCDILQVSGVDLKCSEQANFTITPYGVSHSDMGFSVGVTETELNQCLRCRRYCCPADLSLCVRCASVVKSIETTKLKKETQAKTLADLQEVELAQKIP